MKLTPLALLLSATLAFAGGSSTYDTPAEKDCAKKVSEAIKRTKAECPQPKAAAKCPDCPQVPQAPVVVEKERIVYKLAEQRPAWFLDMGAQYADGPGVFVGPRYQWASGVSLAAHGLYEWAHGDTDPYTVEHECRPKLLTIPGHEVDDRYGVAVMVSIPLGGK